MNGLKKMQRKNPALDLTKVLKGWEFEPGHVTVRQIIGADGRPKVQLRLDLGLLQMELDGRPDGQTPLGKESLFEHYKALAATFEEGKSSPKKFKLNEEDCGKLQQEAVQYYHRYLALFQLEDWKRVVRDTERNLGLFEFVEKHVEEPGFGQMFQQFRPYVLMMRTRALSNDALGRNAHFEALHEAEQGLETIREFFSSRGQSEMAEQSPEVQFLQDWIKELRASRPLSERDKLERAMAEAVAQEDYEKAATLRDTLKTLKS
jgi:hypothetical protein